jgi:hypothetical protein
MAKRRKSKQLSLEQELLTLSSFGHCIVSGAITAYSSVFWPLYCLWSKNGLLQWPKYGRVSSSWSRDNTMTKRRKNEQFLVQRQYNGQKRKSKQFLPVFWPLYCLWSNNCSLFRLLAIVWSLEQELLTLPSFDHCIVSGPRTKSKQFLLQKQYNGQKTEEWAVLGPETIQWPKEGRVSSYCSRDNTMAKRRKSKPFLFQRPYNGQKTEESNNCSLFRLLAIVLSLDQELLTHPSFGHCIAKRRKSEQLLLQRQYNGQETEE